MTKVVQELIDPSDEKWIDQLRLTAFTTNDSEDIMDYYHAVSVYFQGRHGRRLQASGDQMNFGEDQQ